MSCAPWRETIPANRKVFFKPLKPRWASRSSVRHTHHGGGTGTRYREPTPNPQNIQQPCRNRATTPKSIIPELSESRYKLQDARTTENHHILLSVQNGNRPPTRIVNLTRKQVAKTPCTVWSYFVSSVCFELPCNQDYLQGAGLGAGFSLFPVYTSTSIFLFFLQ